MIDSEREEAARLDPTAVLQVRELRKTYFQGDTHIHAVRDAYLKVQPGEFVAITGSSGSGKSTLLHMMAGMDRPTSGRVYIRKTDLYALRDRESAAFRSKRIGFIFQSFNLLPVLTARENILMPCLIAGRPVDAAYFDELVTLLGIADRLHHLPSELSGGQQQRVAAARALINQPELLFADEPTGNLDAASADELIALLLDTRQKLQQTLVLVTHNPALAALADRQLTMTDGTLTERGRA